MWGGGEVTLQFMLKFQIASSTEGFRGSSEGTMSIYYLIQGSWKVSRDLREERS